MYSVYKKRDFKVVDSDFDVVTDKNIDNLSLQLEWIKALKEQIDFANKQVLEDFIILYKVELRRPPL